MDVHRHFKLEGTSHDRESLALLCSSAIKDPALPEWKREIFLFLQQYLDPAQKPIKQFTSGTTGDPRKHLLCIESMIQSARMTLDYFKLKPGDRVLLCLPVRYVAGKLMLVRALLGGLDLILTEPSGRPLRELTKAVSFAAMVPLQVHESLMHGDELTCLSTLLIGGGEIAHPTKIALEKLKKPEVFESFGMTETYTHFALRRLNGEHPEEKFRLLGAASISLDKRQCLVVEIPGITSGPVTTNDLVDLDPGGSTFQWLGRYDNVINTGGIKVIPELLEEQIRKLIQLECLVLPQRDVRLGMQLVLLVESTLESPPVDHWLSELKKQLSSYEIPRRILVVKAIPRNPFMKPDRKAALELLSIH